MALKLYDTLTRAVREYTPLPPAPVGLYTCGMTVYDYAHIGHGRKYTMDDVLRRTLEYTGYTVKHVQNVTDVGHLASDSDDGEDKLEKGAKKFGKTVWDVAQFFTNDFYASMEYLNILKPHIIARATDHIEEQITLIETLISKGFAYDTEEAVYFNVTSFPTYGSLGRQSLESKMTAVRDEVKTGDKKHNPADFVLWFKRTGRFTDHAMHWPSPWGDGFPGWHIECSAMSMKYLGETIDIHTGGIDHIPVHHENEIAQSEAATGNTFVRFWVHHAFLTVDGEKMSKSLNNFIRIEDVRNKGVDPLALRYLYLNAHYRSQLNFTWEALANAQNALNELRIIIFNLPNGGTVIPEVENNCIDAITNDLNTPQLLACIWNYLRDHTNNYSNADKKATLLKLDSILGLGLEAVTKILIPAEVVTLCQKRSDARSLKKWELADAIRNEIEALGFMIEDTDTNIQKIVPATFLSKKLDKNL